MTPRSPMTPRLSQSPRWPKVESITTRQLHYCWDKRPPVYKQLWFSARGSRQDSTVLDETWALARASNKLLYAFALLWTSYSLSFGDSDTGHNTVRIGHGTTDWFQIGKGVCQGCILSPCLFNLYTEYIMKNAGLDEAQAEIKIAGRNINNLR